uniref:Uncharacterized protein n=1 Tax=Glossina austeni TaxID=7395 RepID=A0A1A9UD89_GLOAU
MFTTGTDNDNGLGNNIRIKKGFWLNSVEKGSINFSDMLQIPMRAPQLQLQLQKIKLVMDFYISFKFDVVATMCLEFAYNILDSFKDGMETDDIYVKPSKVTCEGFISTSTFSYM